MNDHPTEPERSVLAEELKASADAVRDAVTRFKELALTAASLDATELSYKPSPAGIDLQRYMIESVNALYPYRNDGPLQAAVDVDQPFVEMVLLSLSPHWQDRIRAQALECDIRNSIALPDGFPCIYEPADSPRRSGTLTPQPFVWVASPDEELLEAALPLYRELWASYESQWPTSPSRTFVVGRLDGVKPRDVIRPGATVRHIIAQTFLTHPDMYSRAPEHLRQMHPHYEQRTAARTR